MMNLISDIAGVLRTWVLVFVISGFGVLGTAVAQKTPMKFGKVSAKDFALQNTLKDTAATALILGHYGATRFTSNMEAITEYHVRIKILSVAGFRHGEQEILYFAEDRDEDVFDIAGRTYSMEDDGSIKIVELNRKDIFTESIDGRWKRKKFALPNLAPGVIIEYRYKFRTNRLQFLDGWTFHWDEPVLWSEYRIRIPANVTYARAINSFLPFEIEEESWVTDLESNEYSRGRALQLRYAMKDIPALREEPFMTTLSDYESRLELQLAQISYGRGDVVRYIKSWRTLALSFLEIDYPVSIRGHRALRKTAKTLAANETTQLAKAKAIYGHLANNYTWNNEHSFLVDNLKNFVRSNNGDTAEFAMALLSMLRSVGVKAEPILISTRDHGRIVDQYPMALQFNVLAVYAQIEGVNYVLDATDPNRAFGMLPFNYLNEKAFVVSRKPAWISTPPQTENDRRVRIQARLTENGSIDGKFIYITKGYQALTSANLLKAAGSKEKYLSMMAFPSYAETVFDSVTHTYDVERSRFEIQANFSIKRAGVAVGDFLYVNPFITRNDSGNPLNQETRQFPIDFGYPYSTGFTMALDLPPGYKVEAHPKTIRYTLPNEKARFQSMSNVQNGKFTVSKTFRINQEQYPSDDYGSLKELFGNFVSSQDEQIVLRRGEAEHPSGK